MPFRQTHVSYQAGKIYPIQYPQFLTTVFGEIPMLEAWTTISCHFWWLFDQLNPIFDQKNAGEIVVIFRPKC